MTANPRLQNLALARLVLFAALVAGCGDASISGGAGSGSGGDTFSGMGGEFGTGGEFGGTGGVGGDLGGTGGVPGTGGNPPLPPPPTGPGIEARCTELGTNCACSEPLNNNGIPNWVHPDNHLHNPSDSPSGYECGNDGNGTAISSTDNIRTALVTDMPANPAPGYHYQYLSGISKGRFFGEGLPERGPARACFRHYRRWSPTFPQVHTGAPTGSAECRRQKILEVTFNGGSGDIQGSIVNNNDGSNRFATRYTTGDQSENLPTSGDELSHFDCMDQWCRIEYCIGGDLSSGSVMELSAEIVGVDDGRRMQLGPATHTNVGTVDDVFVNLWHNGGACGDDNGDWQGLSHMMQAEWPSDDGQTIGPACEVEGGCP